MTVVNNRDTSRTNSQSRQIFTVVGWTIAAMGVVLAASGVPAGEKFGLGYWSLGLVGIGQFLSIAGSVVLSTLSASESAAASVRSDISQRLQSVNTSLVQTYHQITEALDRGLEAPNESATVHALVYNAANRILTEIAELGKLHGQGVDAEVLIDVNERLHYLKEQLRQENLSPSLLNNVDEITTRLSELESSISSVPTEVSGRCPACGATNTTTLKFSHGQTKQIQCRECNRSINFHRRNDMSVFVRLADANSELSQDIAIKETVEISCPRCEQSHAVTFVDDTSSKAQVCLRCSISYTANSDGSVVGEKELISSYGKPIGMTANRYYPVTTCPSCDSSIRCYLKNKDDEIYAAYCVSDAQLVKVPYEEFATWKASRG